MKNILTFLFSISYYLIQSQTYATLPLTDNFTSNSLSSYWSTSATNSVGKVDTRNESGSWPKFGTTTDANGNSTGGNGLAIYNTSSLSSDNKIDANLSLNLLNKTGVSIKFSIVDWGTGYSGSLDSLKIYISNDGGSTFKSNFTLVNLNQAPYSDGVWNNVNLDISALALSNSIVFSETTVLKFRFNLKGKGDTTSPKSGNQFIYIDNMYVTNTGTLPVELYSFSCNKRQLQWVTLSEINNDYFEVQTLVDGVFVSIDIVNGNGNSNDILEYSYNIPISSYEYFRLKQIDFDGNYSFSNTIYCNGLGSKRVLIKIINDLGQQVNSDYIGFVIYIYDNGDVVKQIINIH